ncbi:MAG: hypothetical protein LBJ00_14420 [Planctomycetaceae bacterium]|nr:hypothetical protein [Planctomycetaceae bacterium]
MLYSSCFKISEAEHASVASRSGCSRAKPLALPATIYDFFYCSYFADYANCARWADRDIDSFAKFWKMLCKWLWE